MSMLTTVRMLSSHLRHAPATERCGVSLFGFDALHNPALRTVNFDGRVRVMYM
jgi:hypothetical protein